MYPILFEAKFFQIQSLWLFVSLGFLASMLFLIYLAKTHRLKLNFILNYGLKMALFSLLFARLFYVISNYDAYFFDFSLGQLKYVFFIWDQGLSFWGAVLGFLIGLRRYCKLGEENLQEWLDVIIIAFFMGMTISSIGLFLDGANYGHESNLPWAVNFENITVRYSVPVHPTQLYSALYNFILLIVSWRLYVLQKFKDDGDLFLAGISAFSLFSFLEGFLRGDEVLIILGLRYSQYFELIIGLISLFLLLDRYNKVDLKKIFKRITFLKKKQHGNT